MKLCRKLPELIVLWCALAAVPALATPVFVRGTEEGQGFAFHLGDLRSREDQKKCFAITAAHVVGEIGSPVTIFDSLGQFKRGSVFSRNDDLDLAIVGSLNNFGATNSGTMCSPPFSTLRSMRPLASNPPEYGYDEFWVDRVSSAAGGFERELLGRKIRYDGGFIKLAFDKSTRISRGDSGASVWTDLGMPDPKHGILVVGPGNARIQQSFGTLVGLLVATDDTAGILVPAEEIRTYIYNAFQPANIKDIQVYPKSANIVAMFRGPFPALWGAMSGQFLPIVGLGSLSLEIDFGERDNFISAIEIRFSTHPKQGMDFSRFADLEYAMSQVPFELSLSQFRPRPDHVETLRSVMKGRSPAWIPAPCTASLSHNDLVQDGEDLVLECAVRNTRIVRGARLTVYANPNSIKAIHFRHVADERD